MKSEERRSHRLNYLLRCYLTDPHENILYKRAKLMGVSDSTAKDYIRTVIVQGPKNPFEVQAGRQARLEKIA